MTENKTELTDFGRGYKEGLTDATVPLRDRIVALEILLDAKNVEAKERERLLAEKEFTIGVLRREIFDLKKDKVAMKFVKPRDINDEQ